MLLRRIQFDSSNLPEEQKDFYVLMTRAMYLFNLCINDYTVMRNSNEVFSKRGKKRTICTRIYHFFPPDDPDYESCSVEIESSSDVRFMKLHLFGQTFSICELFRPSHNISATDYEFIIATNVLPSFARPHGENRDSKQHIMGEIHDFIGDYER